MIWHTGRSLPVQWCTHYSNTVLPGANLWNAAGGIAFQNGWSIAVIQEAEKLPGNVVGICERAHAGCLNAGQARCLVRASTCFRVDRCAKGHHHDSRPRAHAFKTCGCSCCAKARAARRECVPARRPWTPLRRAHSIAVLSCLYQTMRPTTSCP